MEVVYKCEVLFYCFQNQQAEEKIIKEQNCFSRISVDFNLLYAFLSISDRWKLRLVFPGRRKGLNHAIWSTASHSKNFCKTLPSPQYFLHLVKLNTYQYKLLKEVFESKS